MTSETAQDDLIKLDWDSWSDSTDASRLSDFSAVCYLFADAVFCTALALRLWPNPVQQTALVFRAAYIDE